MLTDIKAKWKKLLFINYQVDESILRPYLPYGTELALWNGSSYISLIGFLFIDTTISGIPIPLHTNFTEINFRFYVRNLFNGQWRYGVVFIREIVGLPMVTFVANRFFNEHYKTMRCGYEQNVKEGTQSISYRWKRKKWNCISIQSPVESNTALPGSHEEFLTAQHWGFTKVNDVRTRVYSVEHP